MYKLTRTRVGESSRTQLPVFEDTGFMSTNFRTIDPNRYEEVIGARPQVGWQVRLDNAHTWIQTSPIVEIISDEANKVVFKTKSGSVYTWEITGGIKIVEYPNLEENNKNKEESGKNEICKCGDFAALCNTPH